MKTRALLLLALVPVLAAATPTKKPKDSKEPATKTQNIRTKDVTGTYRATGNESDEFSVDVVQGDTGVALDFTCVFGISAHTCDCALEGTPAGDGKWKLSGGATGTFAVMGSKILVELDTPAECCGAGFPGAPDFKVAGAQKPKLCTVKSAKTTFEDAAGTATKKLLAKGDKVEAFAEGSEEADDVVLARASGKKRAIGFLKAGDLDCPGSVTKPAATPEEPAPTP